MHIDRTFIRAAGLLSILLLLAISGFIGKPEAAYGSGYGAASIIHACDAGTGGEQPWLWDYELNYIYWASNDIMSYAFAGASIYVWVYLPEYEWGYYQWVGPTYGHRQNFVIWDSQRQPNPGPRSTTTVANVLNGITDCELNHDFTTFLYIGHNGYEYRNGAWHYGFKQNGYGQDPIPIPVIWDDDIDSRTSYPSNHRFVFLWVCRNANDDSAMPYAWAQTSLGTDGYSSPDGSGYCFIGFKNASPFLCKPINGGNNLYKHWLVFFYYWAAWQAGRYNTIKQALDIASQNVGYYDFTYSPLGQLGGFSVYWPGPTPSSGWMIGWMRVRGDGNVHLPGTIYYGGP